MEHTQEDWIFAGNTTISRTDPAFYHANVVCGGKRIARVTGIGEDEAMANARLIVKAPKLLATCEELMLLLVEAHAEEMDAGHNGDSTCSYCDAIGRVKELIEG